MNRFARSLQFFSEWKKRYSTSTCSFAQNVKTRIEKESRLVAGTADHIVHTPYPLLRCKNLLSIKQIEKSVPLDEQNRAKRSNSILLGDTYNYFYEMESRLDIKIDDNDVFEPFGLMERVNDKIYESQQELFNHGSGLSFWPWSGNTGTMCSRFNSRW